MNSTMAKQPWPSDVVVVVCGPPEAAVGTSVEWVHRGQCRYCGADVVAHGRTMIDATLCGLTHGRRVGLMCEGCVTGFDFGEVTAVVDYRR